jgi:hypothetical protein
MDAHVRFLFKRSNIADPNQDQNVGSARNTNSTTSAFLSTLSVSLLIFAALTLVFVVLRRTNRRIYAPRTYVSLLRLYFFLSFFCSKTFRTITGVTQLVYKDN